MCYGVNKSGCAVCELYSKSEQDKWKYAYMSERFLLWILQICAFIKTNKLVMSDYVVFFPCYNTIFVSVELRKPLLRIIQSIFSVDMLNP